MSRWKFINESRWEFSHKSDLDKTDTGLRFTDVLFGFVIKELFTGFSDWGTLSGGMRAHLATGSVLVLGSYIGFRKSLQRRDFKLFFFNLPLVRFILDQWMVFLYFRFATKPMDDADLVRTDLNLLIEIFALYVAWDLVSCWMSNTKYPRKDDKCNIIPYDVGRLWISLAIFLAFGGMGLASCLHNFAESCPVSMEVAAIVLLVVYRVLKDARRV